MRKASCTASHWTPTTPEEREQAQKELDAILSSHHFRGSRRYPAFLKYVVDAALEGRSGNLKERTLGVEVFGRDPNYDTNADPIVRISAGEVRKRIAQYYHESANHSGVQIELPLGSYVPEFIPWLQEVSGAQPIVEAGRSEPGAAPSPGRRHRHLVVASSLAALLLAAAGLAAFLHRRAPAPTPSVTDKLWLPFFESTRPVLIVVGTSHPKKMAPESPDTSFMNHMTEPYHHVSMLSAVALAHVAGVLQQHGMSYVIKEAPETSLIDIRSRPLILIGATNNQWTMHLVSSLKIRFLFDGRVARIRDTRNLQQDDWAIDFSEPFSSVTTDYAIVARFQDTTTEGPVLVVAGLGPYGTEAASEFVASPQYLDQILKKMPAGWENKNVEMVLRSDVIDSKTGPPVLVATNVW